MAPRKKKKKASRCRRPARQDSTRTARLNLMIRPDLKKWAHAYARRRDKSLSSLINEHLIELREKERGAEVPQI